MRCPVHGVQMTHLVTMPVPRRDLRMNSQQENIKRATALAEGDPLVTASVELEEAMKESFPFAVFSAEELMQVPRAVRRIKRQASGAIYEIWQCPDCRKAARLWSQRTHRYESLFAQP